MLFYLFYGCFIESEVNSEYDDPLATIHCHLDFLLDLDEKLDLLSESNMNLWVALVTH